MLFLCLNVNNDYNYGMGGADIVDLLRGLYRFDKWMRNYKWWHAILWWGFQVLLINSYKVYCRFHEENELKPLSHYEFQNAIGKKWLDPDCDKYKPLLSRNNNFDGSGSLSSMSTGLTRSRGQSWVSEISLNPMDGPLKCCMNHTIVHFPTAPNSAKLYCQLHYWTTCERKYTQCAYYDNCNVVLCIDRCYEVFHTK